MIVLDMLHQWRCAAGVEVEQEAAGEVRLPNARNGDLQEYIRRQTIVRYWYKRINFH